MAGENEDLAFYLPEHQTFNRFVDAMCIPKCCENQKEAELFINFLCDPEIASQNMEWIGYSSPIDPQLCEPETEDTYPTMALMKQGKGYLPLERKTTRLMEELFMQVRNGIKVHLPD